MNIEVAKIRFFQDVSPCPVANSFRRFGDYASSKHPQLFTVVKVKAHQPWTSPEGSRMLKFPDFKTVGI